MTAEILTVGTEILLGNILNANAAFISQQLAGLGISVYCHTSVGDNHKRLAAAFASAFEKADIVITTGGLGPTQDDITKSVAAEYFGLTLEMHEESRLRIRKRFESAGRVVPEGPEQRNALIPAGAEALPNDFGLAPGICIEKNGKVLIMLPGPPHEMQPMFKNYATKFLQKKTDQVFVSRILKIIGMGETAVETELRDIIDAQTNPTIAPYAKVGEVHIRVTAAAPTEARARALITPVADEIYTRMNPRVYGEDESSLAEIVINLLKEKGHTLAIAESCTGGLIASNLVSIAGSSAVFREGFVTYSNEAKTARLNVPEELLAEHGAVSEEVAAAMAKGAAETAGTTIGLSTTGIAGPEGGSPEKPVGLVFIGLYIRGLDTQVSQHNTIGKRNEVRTRSAILALDLLRRNLQNQCHT